jgi:hypothetical protein
MEFMRGVQMQKSTNYPKKKNPKGQKRRKGGIKRKMKKN